MTGKMAVSDNVRNIQCIRPSCLSCPQSVSKSAIFIVLVKNDRFTHNISLYK